MIGLLIADDHPIVREGIKRIVDAASDMRVVAEASNGHEAVKLGQGAGVDVLLLDVSMPGPRFLDTMSRLRTHCPDLPVLVLSVHPEDSYAVRALRAGAAGYLTKELSPQELTRAIRRVHQGGKYVSETLAQTLALKLDPEGSDLPHESLSDREYEVFLLIAEGRSLKEIAGTLCLSPKTVSTYRSRVLEKMRLDGNAQLIRYALEQGLAD